MNLLIHSSARVLIRILLLLCVFNVPAVSVAQEAAESDPSQWVMPNANYAGWNYSALDQINVENVQTLARDGIPRQPEGWKSLQIRLFESHSLQDR